LRIIGAGTRRDFEYRELHTFWTLPNLITVLRFLAVPLFVWFIAREAYGAATITLVVLGSTDWVDGYIARRFNQVSSVGKWLDPVADRLALIIVAITFVAAGIAPWWLLLSIIIPDAILLVFSLILFHGSPDLPVTNIGKIRTALLLVGTPLLLLHRVEGFGHDWLLGVSYIILAAGCTGHVLAWLGYMRAAWRKYKTLPAAAGDGPSRG
jgi:cardiolipin synthase (CMP-forming)